MNACPRFDHLLVLPHLRVQNANAISSPMTHGFPSITAFLGLLWALARKARAAGLDVAFQAIGVVCHAHQEQVTDDPFVRAFCLTRNPINKDGGTAAIVEEGRIHLELSLVLALRSERWSREQDAIKGDSDKIAALLAGMRIAGGTVLPPAQPGRRRHQPFHINLTGADADQQQKFSQARMRLLPGYTLVSRDDLLDARYAELHAANAQATRLDAWLSLARINWRYQTDSTDGKDGKGRWGHDRKGWIVPIPVGYGALSEVYPPGRVANARDATTPFRFVESLYSVGEWISPHRLQTPRQLLWYADSQPENGLYRCRNDYQPTAAEPLFDDDY